MSTPTPSPICFDMDGIILEGPGTQPGVYDAAADAALADLDLETEPTPAQRRDLRNQDTDAIVDRCAELGIDPDRFWQLKDRYASQGTHDRIRSGARGTYDDIDAIHDIAGRTTIGLVTNNRHETAVFVADYFEFDFDVVRGRDPTIEGFHRRKPDPYYLEEALSDLETPTDAADGIYVGDKATDIHAGTELGLETVYVRRPHNRDRECPVDATDEVETLSELLELVDQR